MMDLVKGKATDIPHYDGGVTIIDRLKMVFNVTTRAQLTECIGFSTGSMSTWQTRNTTPFEVICRVSLATGARLEWLLLGKGEMYDDPQKVQTDIDFLKTENGRVTSESEFSLEQLASFKPANSRGLSIELDRCIYFIDTSQNDPTVSGQYLISINDVHQVGDLKLLPDGKIYLLDEGDRFPVDLNITKVIGKVTGVLTMV